MAYEKETMKRGRQRPLETQGTPEERMGGIGPLCRVSGRESGEGERLPLSHKCRPRGHPMMLSRHRFRPDQRRDFMIPRTFNRMWQ